MIGTFRRHRKCRQTCILGSAKSFLSCSNPVSGCQEASPQIWILGTCPTIEVGGWVGGVCFGVVGGGVHWHVSARTYTHTHTHVLGACTASPWCARSIYSKTQTRAHPHTHTHACAPHAHRFNHTPVPSPSSPTSPWQVPVTADADPHGNSRRVPVSPAFSYAFRVLFFSLAIHVYHLGLARYAKLSSQALPGLEGAEPALVVI